MAEVTWFGPTLHERAPHLEQIRAQISVYRLTGARVRQRTLRSQIRARIGLRHPITKARAKAVHSGVRGDVQLPSCGDA